jgi:hypothetical protein
MLKTAGRKQKPGLMHRWELQATAQTTLKNDLDSIPTEMRK